MPEEHGEKRVPARRVAPGTRRNRAERGLSGASAVGGSTAPVTAGYHVRRVAPSSDPPSSSEATSPHSILVVDDDDTLRTRLAAAFRKRGYEASEASSEGEARALATADSPEYAVVDLRLGADSGLDVVRALRAIDAETKIVVLTGYGSIATAMEAVRLGATGYITKPADVDDVLAAFARSDSTAVPAPGYSAPSLARAEWEHINRVLADCEGNISEAARRLKIHRRSLQRKLQKRPPKE
jgi:two-component system response regulator RegA